MTKQFYGTALVALCFWFGCSSPPTHRDGSHKVFENVHEVSKTEVDSARTYRVVAGMRVGATSAGIEKHEFEYVDDLAIDSAGMIYVFDLGPHLIRVIRPDGTFSHEIGERGSGPKSLGAARAIAITGDTILVLSTGGLMYFRTNGDLLGTKRWPVSGTGLIRATPDSVYILMLKRGRPIGGSYAWDDSLRMFATTRALDNPIALRGPAVFAYRKMSYGEGITGPPVLGVYPKWTIAPNGTVLIADPDSFAIHVKDATGATIKTVVARLPRVKTTRADLKDFQAHFQRDIDAANRQIAENPFRLQLKGPRKEFRPFLGGWYPSTLAVSSSGHVIVQRYDISKRPYFRTAPESVAEWIIFSPSWHVAGRFSTRGTFSLMLFEDCTIYGTEIGEFDEQILVSYKLQGLPMGAAGDALSCRQGTGARAVSD